MADLRTVPTRSNQAIAWLLDGDPSIRWQTMRDLTGASKRAVERERRRVARDGWGARLLAKQHRDGRWAPGRSSDDGMYSPKWISTTYTMLLLRDLGLLADNARARKSCALLLDLGINRDGGIGYGFWKASETCVTGLVLSILSHFEYDDDRLDAMLAYILAEQMSDGGWNCRRRQGATHSSMHTTINVLEGLRLHELHRGSDGGGQTRVRKAQRRGQAFLLAHRLFRSHRTGEVIKQQFTRLAFPPRWYYDVLRALDYFQAVNAPRDPRLRDAIELVESRQSDDGRWPLEHSYRGKTYFELEHIGAPSRWNTLRALRVLKWWRGTN